VFLSDNNVLVDAATTDDLIVGAVHWSGHGLLVFFHSQEETTNLSRSSEALAKCALQDQPNARS
jgi:hypothetical protein